MIKNVIFDVGDVLLEYRWKDMLMEYGLSEQKAVSVGTEMFNNDLWGECMDRGIMTQDEVIEEYRKRYPEEQEIIEWFINHGEKMHVARPEIWKKAKQLKDQGMGIYLLSNYSEELFQKHTKDADFMNWIDGKVVSYEIHKVKPEPEIYEYLLETYELDPSECIFYDDRMANVEAAIAMGIQAIHVTSREMLGTELDKILRAKSDYITTYTGKRFYPLYPEPDKIDIKDIAHALPLICRGNGQVKHFYSVGEHCISCAQEAEARGYSKRVILGCLLHDASECYMSDVPRPFKKYLKDYQNLEEQMLDCIYKKFLGSNLQENESKAIREIDNALLAYDLFYLLGEGNQEELPELQIPYSYGKKTPKEVETQYYNIYQKTKM